MASRFVSQEYISDAIGSTATVVIFPTIDISNYERFSLQLENYYTAVSAVHFEVQVTNKPSGTAANEPPHWISANTTVMPFPSALAPTAVFGQTSSVFANSFNYMRVLARTDITGIRGGFHLIISGFTRLA